MSEYPVWMTTRLRRRGRWRVSSGGPQDGNYDVAR
jgi:hypothetical protein